MSCGRAPHLAFFPPTTTCLITTLPNLRGVVVVDAVAAIPTAFDVQVIMAFLTGDGDAMALMVVWAERWCG
ncbi:hypothetical protein C8R44DRAFT_982398 [Mycena epipterygia]|nr:hypothetical protein C8R44DRAFT_982398 [Mycena epipterygia]